MENYFHHDKFVKGDLYSISQIRRKPEKKKTMKHISNDYCGQQQRYSESDVLAERKNGSKINRTEVTLNSVHTIKPKSEYSIILMRENLNIGSKVEPIYYEECDSAQ